MANKITRVAPSELDGLVKRARGESWRELVLLGPSAYVPSLIDYWPQRWKVAAHVFKLSAIETGLVGKLQSLTGLTSLDLSDNQIGDQGAKAIAASLTGLTSLNLTHNRIGTSGAKAIAASLTGLTSLSLESNDIGPEAAESIAANLVRLTSLDLRSTEIGIIGTKAIAASLIGLTSLNLMENFVDDEGAKAIAASLRGLTSLNLIYTGIGLKGTEAITASLTGLTSLDLSVNKIGDEGAKMIAASLVDLVSLDLIHCGICVLGAKALANSLTSLTSLDLRDNRIGNLGAQAIAASLKRLNSLNLGLNGIGSEGADAIATSLTGLTSLDLAGSNIGNKGAKAIAASLTRLTSLDLSDNQIGNEGAKAIAASLAGLTSLNLSANNIGDEGVRALLDAWSSDERSSQLRRLGISQNDDLGALLPKEILKTTDAQAILAAYRRFFVAQEQRTRRPLNEVKLLVVGNEAVGKTSLLRYLIEGRPRDPGEARTPGIIQHEKITVQGWSPQQYQMVLNVWDFGGQEMMRGTHRFFLTERSLYLLILEDRRQDDRSIYDWLKTIRNRGGNSPIIVVINKSDSGKQDLRLDENTLQTAYPDIVAFLRTSCYPDNWAKGSVERLREKIVDTLTGDKRLKHVQDPIPANWLHIKDRVGELAGRYSVLSHSDFVSLCNDPGGKTEPITENSEQRSLLRLLHELGTIVAHGLERDAPATRREINLLDPNWLTGAIYRIMDRASSVQQEGEFLRSDLVNWLASDVYPPERHEFILDMMQDRDIGLCFRLPAQGEEHYLLPEALPASRRFYGKWPDDSLRFRYIYNYLPPSLIPRFIVQSHQHLTPDKARWRTGVVLSLRDCDALVLADVDQRRVDILVTGPSGLRRPALNVILNDLEAVHALNPEAEPVAVVPLPDRADLHVGYKHLLMLERRRGSDYSFFPDGTDRDYQVGELLDGVRHDQLGMQLASANRSSSIEMLPNPIALQSRQEKAPMSQWYVSYAWDDNQTVEGRAREIVVDRLCAAAKDRGIQILRDKDVLNLGESISAFMRSIGTGDRVFVILSDKYLKSPFCMFELSEIWRTSRQEGSEFLRRVRIFALPDAKIWTPLDWSDWAIHWKQEHDVLDSRARQHGAAILGEYGHRRLMQTRRFYSEVPDILGTLADIVQPRTLKEL